MLNFSSQEITFNFKENSHLTTNLIIRNPTIKFVYFKFKVSRQKYFMVKPDRGVIKPNTQIEISFTIHKDGIADSADDRFQFISCAADKERTEDINGIFKQVTDPDIKKFLVKVNNANHILRTASPPKKQLYNSIIPKTFQSAKKSIVESNDNIDTLIQKKEKRIEQLQAQIKSYQTEKKSNNMSSKSKSSLKYAFMLSFLGLAIGIGLGFVI